MQGKDENIYTSSYKLNCFLQKITLWISYVKRKKNTNISINSRYWASIKDPDGEVTFD